MQPSQPTEKEILKKVLAPLLDDFSYWFSRSSSLLESEMMPFFSQNQQMDLLNRLQQAQREVDAASMLFKVTDCQAGIDTKVLMGWHKLVGECWDVSRRWRQSREII